MSLRTITGKALATSVLLAGSLIGSACATHGRTVVYVSSAPPPAVREVISVSPGAGYIWIPGHHAWDRGSYVWVTGRWEVAPRHSRHWVAGQWQHDRHGWYWVDGHWS
jgi:WXXGXW repeat (2 copies)